MRAATIVLAAFMAAGLSGCGSGEREAFLMQEVAALKEENLELATKCAELEAEAAGLKEQTKTLAELGAEVRTESMYALEAVKITRYSGLYDKDGDGRKEKLIVYVQPVDGVGDVVKAAGEVNIQLWDLNREAGEALVSECHVSAEDLKGMWFDTLLGSQYRVTCDIGEAVGEHERPLTVKMNFTDYLSGKTFSEQRTVRR